MSIGLAMIPLLPQAKLSAAGIKADWASRWKSCGELTSFKGERDQLCFNVGDATLILAVMRAPIPWSELEGPCATSVLWPNAAAELKPHIGHILVTLLGVEDPIERSRMLTRICASVLASCEGAPGVYWGDATLVVPAPVFIDFATEIMPESFPLHIWVDVRVGPNEAGTTSGFTCGMEALGHMEFETESASDAPGDLRERFLALANYVLENGPVIQNGHTVGEDANERIHVVHAPSAFGQKGQVLRLEYTSAMPKKKSWW